MKLLWTLAVVALLAPCTPAERPIDVALVAVAGGSVRYQMPGGSQLLEEQVEAFTIMQRQVSQAEYARCVADGACTALDAGLNQADPQLPAVGLSWPDAEAYALWLSYRTGQRYRLPGYGEWLLAAAEAYEADSPVEDDPRNPSRRWLLEYEREARRGPPSKVLQRFGDQGRNSAGLLDVAGNVWEWTHSCFGQSAAEGFCGVRIAAGRHPSPLSDFIRDPVAGACSVGTPPAYLGMRLVREG